jgi:pimeloyl-ACP methyl ester carboxylesterase
MATHHEEEIFAANGIEICADSFGDRADSVLLLIMGAGCSMIHWDEEWCHRLADGGRFVIRYDNRDTGRTTSLPPGVCNYTFQDMAGDAVAVLDHFGVDKAHIVGQSMGGIIAQLVGLNHPDRVLTLTPIMTTPNPAALASARNVDDSTEALSSSDAVSKRQRPDPSAIPDREEVLASVPLMLESAVGSAYPPEIERMRDIINRDFDRSISYMSSQNHGMVFISSEPFHDRLGTISVPTLVIHGTEDPVVPYDHGQAIADRIPGAELLTMPRVGHWLPRPEYDRVVAAVLAHTG